MKPKAGTTSTPTRTTERSAEDKLRVVIAAGRLVGDELGALLRREGIHEATLEEWRTSALEALTPGLRQPHRNGPAKRILELERQLHRKDKALAEAAALLLLQKKVQALWAVADEDTEPPSDE